MTALPSSLTAGWRASLGDLRELAESIAHEGVLVPLMAERRGSMLQLLHGHRRWAAARMAGLATVPVVVDAGLGAPSHAAEAMEMGADAVLVNTAIAIASDPVRMAKAFKKAIEAGREAREIGLAEKLNAASATSPLTGFLKG